MRKEKNRAADAALRPGLPALKQWFEKSGLRMKEKQYEQLWLYHTLLREKNAEYDLTRIYQFDNMVQKHYIDCMLLPKLLQAELPSPILDIGTGAGLPGIALKIASPKTIFILSEGRHRRIRFLKEVVEALGLKGVEIYEGKIYPSFSRPVQGIITRALEAIPRTLARVRHCLLPEGKAIFMKGPHCDEELKEALDTFRKEYVLLQDIGYNLPRTAHRRRLIIFEKRP